MIWFYGKYFGDGNFRSFDDFEVAVVLFFDQIKGFYGINCKDTIKAGATFAFRARQFDQITVKLLLFLLERLESFVT